MFMLQKVNLFLLIVFTLIMSLVMVAINKIIFKNYLLHHNKNYYYNN